MIMVMASVVDKASRRLPTLHYGPSPLSLSRSLASRGSGGLRVTAHEDLTKTHFFVFFALRFGALAAAATAPASSGSWFSLVFRSGAAGLSSWSFGLVFLADLAGLLVI